MNDPIWLAKVLKVLSVPARVRIAQLLKDQTLCVNALAAHLDVTQGAVSQHLRVMRDAGLLIDEKHGYYVHYRLNEKTLAEWREAIGELLKPAGGSSDIQKGEESCVAATRKSKSAGSRRT